METGIRVYSVRDISVMAKRAIEGVPAFGRIAVRGEVSKVSLSSTGHLYFSLKEGNEIVPCVIWRGVLEGLRARGAVPRNGSSLICMGKISTYSSNGNYQLQCSNVISEGAGADAEALEALKNRLKGEGLFEQNRPLPRFPKKIAVVTSPTGAVIHDIITTTERRYPLTEIVLIPATVQGETAVPSLIEGIEKAQTIGADVIIFGRGGGSSEDLSCFNSEALAREIYASRIPTISAVGHETDVTIADFVADQRAATPTAAAEFAVPDITELLGNINSCENRAARSVQLKLAQSEARLNGLSKKVQLNSPRGKIAAWSARLESVEVKLKTDIRQRIARSEHALNLAANTINGVNPLAVLSRGYSVATKGGKAVKSSAELSVGDTLEIKLDKGEVTAEVIKIAN